MHSFFFREVQLITVLILISSTKFISLKLCVEFSIFDSVFVQQKANGIKVQVFFWKNIESTCAVMIRIIITFGNQIFL